MATESLTCTHCPPVDGRRGTFGRSHCERGNIKFCLVSGRMLQVLGETESAALTCHWPLVALSREKSCITMRHRECWCGKVCITASAVKPPPTQTERQQMRLLQDSPANTSQPLQISDILRHWLTCRMGGSASQKKLSAGWVSLAEGVALYF